MEESEVQPVHEEGVNAEQESGQTGLQNPSAPPKLPLPSGGVGVKAAPPPAAIPKTMATRRGPAGGGPRFRWKTPPGNASQTASEHLAPAISEQQQQQPAQVSDQLGNQILQHLTSLGDKMSSVKTDMTGVKEELSVVQDELATVKDTQLEQQVQIKKQQQLYEELKQQRQQQSQQRPVDGSLVSPSAQTDSVSGNTNHTEIKHKSASHVGVSVAGATHRSNASALSIEKATLQTRFNTDPRGVKVDMENTATMRVNYPLADQLAHPTGHQAILHDDLDERVQKRQTEPVVHHDARRRRNLVRRNLKKALDGTPGVNAMVDGVRADEARLFQLSQIPAGQVAIPALFETVEYALERGCDSAKDYESLRLYALQPQRLVVLRRVAASLQSAEDQEWKPVLQL